MSSATELPYRVTLSGAANVRDLGGYRTPDGRTVRRGRLFRADSLHRATDEDVEALRSLGVRTVIDLRSAGEVKVSGPLISTALGADYLHLEVRHSTTHGTMPKGEDLPQIHLDELYRRYLQLNGEQFATALRLIARPEAAPVLFHCFAGKDRTGIVAALVLSLLGLDDEAVAADYAATSGSFSRFLELVRTDDPPILDLNEVRAIDPSLLEARPETMVALLGLVRERVGSVEALVGRWGVGPDVVADLRAHLLD